MKYRNYVFFLLLFFTLSANGQGTLGNWISYTGTHDLNKKWQLQGNTQIRFHNLFGDINQYLIRINANYHLDKMSLLGLGFDYFYNEPYINDSTKYAFNEYRLFQHLIMKNSIGKVSFMHRYRLEERFRKKDLYFKGDNPSLRFRYMLNGKVNIYKGKLNYPVYAYVLDEVFINFKGNPFETNWVQYGFGKQISKQLTVEIGNQTEINPGGRRNRLQFWLFHYF